MKMSVSHRSIYCAGLAFLLLCTTGASLYAQTGPAKVSLILDRYIVFNENNGAGSHGVNLYFGWIVQAPDGRSGGASNTGHHLQNKNGLPIDGSPNNPHGLHPAEENFFTAEIPEDGAIVVFLQMVAENDTTDQVKAAFRRGQVVDLGNGPPDINFNVSVGNSTSSALSAIVSVFSGVKNMFFAKGSDHDYGHWVLSLVNTGGQIEAKVEKQGSFCSGGAVSPIPIDGQRHGFMSLRFDDKQNNIYPQFDILAAH
jgi:hypothetical protein